MYLALQFACVALFWLSVPLLLLYRGLRSDVPWVFVIVSATALGWILSNAAVFFQHAAIDEERLEERACFTTPHDGNNSTAVVDEHGMTETIVENPCGIGDWIRDHYKPWLGLLYGPLYLLCCALPYWLIIVRRPSLKMRRQMVLLAIGALIVEWVAILGKCTAVFGARLDPDSYCPVCYSFDLYIWMPLTIAAASLVSWIAATQVLQRFKR